MKTLSRIVVLTLAAGAAAGVSAQGDGPGATLLRKHAGSDDSDALLREPAVRNELPKLLGPQIKPFLLNLNVRSSVDVVGGMLSLSGNAPHRGTEDEAVLCVSPDGKLVQAAIFSRGAVTAFARQPSYDNLTLCIKDWVTLVNSRHADRMKQPRNVRVVAAR